jgi:hypothetical protein
MNDARQESLMPRMWTPPEHNPLELRPFKLKAEGSFEPALRAARMLCSQGLMAYPLPSLIHTRNVDIDDDGPQDNSLVMLPLAVDNQQVLSIDIPNSNIMELKKINEYFF